MLDQSFGIMVIDRKNYFQVNRSLNSPPQFWCKKAGLVQGLEFGFVQVIVPD